MGTTTLADRRLKVGRFVLGLETFTPINQALVDKAIADALRQVYRAHRWNFLDYSGKVRLYKGTNDGSVSGTGTAVTGTGTSFTSLSSAANVKVRAKGEILGVTTITDDTNIVTTEAIPVEWADESYQLYADTYSLPSTIETVDALWLATPDDRLQPMGPAEMANMKAKGFESGHPQFFCVRGSDVEFGPIPGFDEWLNISGRKAGTIPTADAGTDDIPDRFSDVVDSLVEAALWKWKGDERYMAAKQEAMSNLVKMVQQENPNQAPDGLPLDPAWFGSRPRTISETST